MAGQTKSRNGLPHPDDVRMSFGDHLEELRSRILMSLGGVVVATVLCLIWNKHVISFAIRPAYVVLRKYGQEPVLQSLSPPDTFLIWIKVALLSGLIISCPLILWQAWRFVAVGLFERERFFVRRFGLAAPLLFIAGVAFMFFIVLPIVLNFFAAFNQSFPVPDAGLSRLESWLVGPREAPSEVRLPEAPRVSILNEDPPDPAPGALWFNQQDGRLKMAADERIFQVQMRPAEYSSAVSNQYSIDFYVSFVLTLSLAFGLAFQLPIVVIFLTTTGITSIAEMTKARGYVILAITVASAMLTPPDVISQIMLAIPMALLYEAGLWISRMMLRSERTAGATPSE